MGLNSVGVYNYSAQTQTQLANKTIPFKGINSCENKDVSAVKESESKITVKTVIATLGLLGLAASGIYLVKSGKFQKGIEALKSGIKEGDVISTKIAQLEKSKHYISKDSIELLNGVYVDKATKLPITGRVLNPKEASQYFRIVKLKDGKFVECSTFAFDDVVGKRTGNVSRRITQVDKVGPEDIIQGQIAKLEKSSGYIPSKDVELVNSIYINRSTKAPVTGKLIANQKENGYIELTLDGGKALSGKEITFDNLAKNCLV